jgi:SAM-dependent methyltransferase
MSQDIAELCRIAGDFSATLQAAKQRIAPTDFDWYPYDSLSNLTTLDRLLGADNRRLLDLAAGKTILDIGCADGDLAFFLESLGCNAHVIDNPIANFNAMRAVRALKTELHSKIQIHEMDLDAQFRLPAETYGLAIFLGTLYHLKNPFHALETISRQARYCLLSTVVTEYIPGIYDTVTASSVAYLADVYELNRDSTNYWVYSDAGLRRQLKRANWEICDYLLTGDRPVGDIAGRRAFCLLRSRFADDKVNVLLGKGWHDLEEGGWRWTARRFALRLESNRQASTNEIVMNLYIPEVLINAHGPVTLFANANGRDLTPQKFTAAGQFEYRQSLSPLSTGDTDVRIDFALDKALAPEPSDDRERGVIVSRIAGQPV